MVQFFNIGGYFEIICYAELTAIIDGRKKHNGLILHIEWQKPMFLSRAYWMWLPEGLMETGDLLH